MAGLWAQLGTFQQNLSFDVGDACLRFCMMFGAVVILEKSCNLVCLLT